eukprot:COSAG02_NODE_3579_length_6535_cov_6.493008_7_plen_120_part_00
MPPAAAAIRPTRRQLSAAFESPRFVEKKDFPPVPLQLAPGGDVDVLMGRGQLPPLDGNRGAGCFSQVLTGLVLEDGTSVKARYCNVCELWYNSAKKAPWDLGSNRKAAENHWNAAASLV